MILQLVGLIAIVIFTIFVAKTANENGRNAVLWGALCAGIGLGLQIVAMFVVMTVIAIILVATGTPPDPNMVGNALGWWSLGISVFLIGLSLVGMFLVLRHVAQIPEDEEPPAVPPPPTFEHDNK